jgi:tetratricopeptide (TPR) repeat protein
MLVVLDNANCVEQVRALLPGSSSCFVVVTSRDSLAGLVARHGARRLDLDLLPPDDAIALLRALIGGRVNAEPDAAAALAGQCARLPLALRVAAELAASRPGSSLAELVGELAEEQRRLDRLDAGGDPRTAVRAVFSWSYRHLPSDAARAFRLSGLHPGPDLDGYAAALFDTGRDQVHQLLDLLARAHLIAPTNPGRYSMHDLLRAYATHLATVEDTEEQWRAALTRLFDYYLTTAAAAMDTLHPAEQHRRPHISAPATPAVSVTDPTAARTWLDLERAALTTTCAHALTHGWFDHTIRLASTLFRYLETGGHYPDALSMHTHALNAARDLGDLSAESHMLCNLGEVYWRQGHYQQATDHHQQALTLAREIGDRLGQAHALTNLGEVYWRQGRCQQATDHHQQALTVAREIGDQAIETHALTNLGVVYWRQGRYQDAADHHQQAVALAREISDQQAYSASCEEVQCDYS